jgi:polyadenylate-binding protein 2
VEFMDKSSIANAVELNESIFKGRPLKVLLILSAHLAPQVTPKRTNLPSFLLRGKGVAGARGGRRPRGRRPARRRAYYNPYY